VSRRKVALLAILGGFAFGVGLNVTGVAPIPRGPVGVGSPPPDGHFGIVVLPAGRADHDGSVYTTMYLSDTWPVAATLLSITPMGVTDSAQVAMLGTAVGDPTNGLALGATWDPGPGWGNPIPIAGATIPTGGPGKYLLVLVGVHPTTAGDAAVSWFSVDYAIGPFRFRSVDETSVLVCAAPGATTRYPESCTP